MRKQIAFTFIFAAGALLLPPSGIAKVIKLDGTRDQVRAACTEQGG